MASQQATTQSALRQGALAADLTSEAFSDLRLSDLSECALSHPARGDGDILSPALPQPPAISPPGARGPRKVRNFANNAISRNSPLSHSQLTMSTQWLATAKQRAK